MLMRFKHCNNHDTSMFSLSRYRICVVVLLDLAISVSSFSLSSLVCVHFSATIMSFLTQYNALCFFLKQSRRLWSIRKNMGEPRHLHTCSEEIPQILKVKTFLGLHNLVYILYIAALFDACAF